MPLAVYTLTLGIFCIGTSEFMFVGLLPQLASSLQVSISAAGYLVSLFAIGMVIGSPLMAVVTLKIPRKRTLLAACAVFAAAHAAVLFIDNYPAIVALRIIAALACATYWAIGAVLAVENAPAGRTAEALAMLIGGLTLANVIGVPIGTWIGGPLGWRASFFAVAACTVVCALAIKVLVVDEAPKNDVPLKSLVKTESAAFKNPAVWLALATTALSQAGIFCAFTYLVPVLLEVSGIPESLIPAVLLAFGLGSLLGVMVGGRLADNDPKATLLGGLTCLAVVVLLLILVARQPVGEAVAVFAFGAAAFSIGGALNARVFHLASGAPTLAAAVNVSAFNIGNTLGPALGGALLSRGWGWSAPLWAALGLVIATIGVALWAHKAADSRTLAAKADRTG
ncbi:MFS transporter [Couchioplanes caeruleus]|nr:MFS transporter [Couchioplanes caeruleus]